MDQPQKLTLFPNLNLSSLLSEERLKTFIKENENCFTEENEYQTINFFKDGKPFLDFNLKKLKELQTLSDLPCSLRITNIQVLFPAIFKLCNELKKYFDRTFTCNLYYTPGKDRNCFEYHVDDQITFIYQVQGQKNWFFPIKDDEVFKYYGSQTFTPGLVKNFDTKNFLLQAGDQFFVPYGSVHKVEIEGEIPSIHLTFGSFEYTKETVINNFMALALSKTELHEKLNMRISKNELTDIITTLKDSFANTSTENFVKQFEEKMFADELNLMKKGRIYRKGISANQD